MSSLTFIHIGKNGGGSILETLKSKKLMINGKHHKLLYDNNHRKRLMKNNTKYVFFVRDPVTRFVSGFIYVLIYYFESKVAFPHLVKYKNMFATPNDLALGLTSENDGIRNMAREAMKHIIHVKDNLSTYLYSSNNIKNCKQNILFVGRYEHFNDDMMRLKDIVGMGSDTKIPHHRNMASYSDLKHLDEKAIENIRNYYKSDYEIIKTLISEGHIDESYLSEILNCEYD